MTLVRRDWLVATRWLSWPGGPVLLTAFGLLAAGTPEDFEGPTLFYFGNGHGLDLSNAAAIALLIVGVVGLTWGAVRHAQRISMSARNHVAEMASLFLMLTLGILLLVFSGTSTAVTLWALGTLLVVTALLGLMAYLR
jgi:hypothetical protein